MKGIIFNLIQEVVTDTYGDDTWDTLLEAADLDGSYTSVGSYPDEDLFRLVGAASSALHQPPDQVLRQLGQGAIPLLAARFPGFFENHTSRSFLLTLNDVIHAEVRKLYPGAEVPDFDFGTDDAGVLIVGYRSRRRLCALAEGFILGAAAHFGDCATLEQTQCMNQGASKCLIRCALTPVSV